ncbi:MAG: MarR family transcriptional regulator [Terracidiphilus sp.]|jgi:DNA-binding MarR family transcriptional regulator
MHCKTNRPAATQLDLLAEVRAFSPITVEDLAGFLGEPKEAVRRRVRRLELMGLVDRTKYRQAGESTRWVLSDAGEREARR